MGRSVTPSLRAGLVCIDTRAQAVLPTAMAPSIANDSRHHSAGILRFATARVASYPARAAGSANSNPRTRRNGRARDREGVLPDDACEPACNEANDNRTERTCCGLIGIDARGHADELCGVPRYMAHAQKLRSRVVTLAIHASSPAISR